jgi:iron complex transport system ATP-binding protein
MELVLMGRFPFQGLLPFDRAVDLEAARTALELVEAADLAHRLLPEMSGGERQRVHLARALAQEPTVLLLDEPASSLDLRFRVETYRLLHDLNRQRSMTVVIVSHDLNLPGAHADHVAVLDKGRLSALGTPTEILKAEVLEPVYGTKIIEAWRDGHDRPFLHPEA